MSYTGLSELLDKIAWLIVYAAIPIYVLGLIITIGGRDLCELFDLREFAKNILRKLL